MRSPHHRARIDDRADQEQRALPTLDHSVEEEDRNGERGDDQHRDLPAPERAVDRRRSGSAASCPDAIALTAALAIAEKEAGGDAVAIVPDDDVACAREVQVVVGATLIEIKVAGDGAVLEHDVSDESED